MGCGSSVPARVVKTEALTPLASSPSPPASSPRDIIDSADALSAWEEAGGLLELSMRRPRLDFVESGRAPQRRSVLANPMEVDDVDEDDDEDVESMAFQLAGTFGIHAKPARAAEASYDSDDEEEADKGESAAGVTTPFRKRRLSRERSQILADLEALREMQEQGAFASKASHGNTRALSPGKISQSAIAATAGLAAERAAKASGKEMLVAKEFEETEERGFEEMSMRVRNDPQRAALAKLTDGQCIGTFSCHGVEPAPGGDGAVAKINQDCACIVHPVNGDKRSALFCVYDGHGEFGTEVSTQALQSIRHVLAEEEGATMLRLGSSRGAVAAASAFGAGTASLRSNPVEALTEAFEAVQAQLKAVADLPNPSVDARDSGACATVAYLRDATLWVAGAGDCTCVLGSRSWTDGAEAWSSTPLSTDHKCDLPGEMERIKAAGGFVRPARYEDGDFIAPARLYEDLHDRMKGPGLAVSRGLGDLKAMKCGLVATPEVKTHAIQDEDRILILASDGVWEFITPQQAVELVAPFYRDGKKAFDACKWLIANAAARWRANEGDYRDDITCIVLWLPDVMDALAKGKAMDSVEEHPVVSTEGRRLSAVF